MQAEVDDVILKLARPTAAGDNGIEKVQVLRRERARIGPEKELARSTTDDASPSLLPQLSREARERREEVPRAFRSAGYVVSPTEFGL